MCIYVPSSHVSTTHEAIPSNPFPISSFLFPLGNFTESLNKRKHSIVIKTKESVV